MFCSRGHWTRGLGARSQRKVCDIMSLKASKFAEVFCFSNVSIVEFGPSLNISSRVGTQSNMVTCWFPSLTPFLSAFFFLCHSPSPYSPCFSFLYFLSPFFSSFSLFSNLTNNFNCFQKYTNYKKEFGHLKNSWGNSRLCRKQDKR